MSDNERALIQDLQQALRVMREHDTIMRRALKEIKQKAESVFRNGAIDKQLQIDMLGRLAKNALVEIDALDKVI